MKPALSQVCTLHASFADDVADYAAAACGSIELWLGKLEGYLEHRGLNDIRRLLAENEITAAVASYQGGLLDSQGEARAEHWRHFHRRLELCRSLGVQTLVVAADVAAPVSGTEMDGVKTSLAEAARAAGEHDVRLALEFQAGAALCNNLQTAVVLVEATASRHLGVCLDAFHFFTGPSKTEDLGYLTVDNLFHVQLSDLSGPPRELARDADRILPGDGDLLLEPIIEHLRAIDYQGYVSLELMNPQIWQIAPLQFAEIGITALRKSLGLASMDSR